MTTRTYVLGEFHITMDADDYTANFRVVEISSWDSKTGAPLTYGFLEEWNEDPGAAAPFLSGAIRWDGCSNWDFHTSECMAHFCGRKHATSIGTLMDRLYDLAAEAIPTFNKELAA